MPGIKLTKKTEQRLAPVIGRFAAAHEWAGYGTEVRLDNDRFPVPWLLYLALRQVVGSSDLGPHEKTRWQVPFRYGDVNALLAHRKFGLRLQLDTTDPAIAKEIQSKLAALIAILEQDVLKKVAATRFREGRVTVMNQATYLRGAYDYFRTQGNEVLRASDAPDTKEIGEPGEPGWLTKGFGLHVERLRIGSYNGLAAINAYFSWLEHVLVLLFAFTEENAGDGALQEHIRAKWTDKYRRVFDVSIDADANGNLSRLHEVAENYRNTYAHGGFDKLGATIGIHISGIGAIPARLTDVRHAPQFELSPFSPQLFTETVATLDEVDTFLRSGPRALPMRFVEAGLDVAFDPRSRRELRGAMRSNEAFEKSLARRTESLDRYLNMDY